MAAADLCLPDVGAPPEGRRPGALLRQTAAEQPDGLYVDSRSGSVTFGEVDRRADRLAAGLLELAPPGSRILLRIRDFATLAAAVVAVDRSGMIVVIQPPAAPVGRIEELLEDLDAALVVSDLAEDAFSVRTEHPDRLERDPKGVELPQPYPGITAIAYTSGSEGVPKGIMVTISDDPTMSDEQYNVVEPRVAWMGNYDWVRIVITVTCALGSVVCPYDVAVDGVTGLTAWLRENRITSLPLVSTVLRAWLPCLDGEGDLPALKQVFVAGEALQGRDAKRLLAHLSDEALLVHSFGQTESSWIAVTLLTRGSQIDDGPVPAGYPVPGVTVSIVNPDGTPVAPGEPGEIVADSAEAGLGYWRRPELTASTFSDLGGGRHRVHTRDRGYFTPEGVLIHLGRQDRVVKISGHRVELAEVEARLRAMPEIDDAAATTYTDSLGDTRLAAFVSGQFADADAEREIRAAAARTLPGHLVPDLVKWLPELPRLQGGKVDGKLLQTTAAEHVSSRRGPSNASAPSSELEATLVRLWGEVLGHSRPGPDDDFFDFGGDSLRAVHLCVGIQNDLGLDVSVSSLIEYPTPALLARALGPLSGDDHSLVAVQAGGERPPLVIIHDGGGEAFYARSLSAHLGPDQPVYALRSSALKGTPPTQRTITELAEHYAELLHRAVPEGPYQFYGASLGGFIAFEMAMALERRGAKVALLAVGDSKWSDSEPKLGAPEPESRRQRLAGLITGFHLIAAARLLGGHLAWRWHWRPSGEPARDERRLDSVMAGGGPVPAELRAIYALRELTQLAKEYEPSGTFDGSVLVLRARSSKREGDLGWSSHSSERARTVDTGLQHSSLGVEAGVGEVAKQLSRFLAVASS